MNKDIKEIIKRAVRQRWTVRNNGGHLCFLSPDRSQPPIYSGTTPRGGRRSLDNLRADLKRAGLEL